MLAGNFLQAQRLRKRMIMPKKKILKRKIQKKQKMLMKGYRNCKVTSTKKR
jgi:hypothetical protein